MFLALDIGNSAVKGGFFDEDDAVDVFSISRPDPSIDEESIAYWTDRLSPRLGDRDVDGIGIVSVVPASTRRVREALRQITDRPITVLESGKALPFDLGYDTPDTLGIDRLAAAAAGWIGFGRNGPRSVIVVDAGTAVNYEVVHRDGTYLGGAIAAGPALARSALREGTAQLPDAPLSMPDDVIGSSTQAGLQSGIMWGLVDGVRGMTDRLAQSLPDHPAVVLTGGWSGVLTEHLQYDGHAPHLVLQGVRLLTLLNVQEERESMGT